MSGYGRTKPDFERVLGTGKMGENIIIGGGISTVFGVLYMLDQGSNPSNIRIIEQKENFKCNDYTFTDTNTFVISIIRRFSDYEPQSNTFTIPKDQGDLMLNNIRKHLQDKIEIHFETRFANILDKYGKYVTYEMEEHVRYSSVKWEENITKMKEQMKVVRREIKDLKKSGSYYAANEKSLELKGISYRLRVSKPTKIERYYNKLFLAMGNEGEDFINEFLTKKRVKIKSKYVQVEDGIPSKDGFRFGEQEQIYTMGSMSSRMTKGITEGIQHWVDYVDSLSRK